MVSKLTWIYKAHHFGSQFNLTNRQTNGLITLFNEKQKNSPGKLMGRGGLIKGSINGLGSVIVKKYYRGGFVRYFFKKRYFRFGLTRSQIEYSTLLQARQAGVNVPEPIVYAYKGWPLCKCWLVTREIEGHKTLAEISLSDEEKANKLTEKLALQMTKLIENRIHHVDLHPGNVIIDNKETIYILDFDKAQQFKSGRTLLRDKYLTRWRRAITKHELPGSISDTLNHELEGISSGL